MKKLLLSLLLSFFALLCVAQQPNEVTLVVTGEGAIKEEATNNALRSAIEQAFGVFVSANTTILNDEFVKDEIATISSGNIKSFKELAYSIGTAGRHSVTIQAVVSVNKLIEYSMSHGAKAEFAGALFGSNLKLAQINKENAERAYNQLIEQLTAMAPFLYDYSLQVSNPKVSGEVTVDITVSTNEYTAKIGEMVYNTLCAISMDEQQAKPLQEMGFDLFEYTIRYIMPDICGTDKVISEGEKRFFYSKLDKNLNRLLCPPETIVIKDDTGRSYFCNHKLIGTTKFQVTSTFGGASILCRPEGIEGFEQGVFDEGDYEILLSWRNKENRYIIIGTYHAKVGMPIYLIKSSLKIPLEHLQSISSFEIQSLRGAEKIGSTILVQDDSGLGAAESSGASVGSVFYSYYVGQYIDEFGGGIVYWVSPDKKSALLISMEGLSYVSWDNAGEWCQSYGDGSWHLPTRKELQLLSEGARTINGLTEPIIMRRFKNLPPVPIDLTYWSGEENDYREEYAFCVFLGNGTVHEREKKSRSLHARAVRLIGDEKIKAFFDALENYEDDDVY